MFKSTIPLRKLISNSSPVHALQDYFQERSPKNILSRSYTISRKNLTILRANLFAFSLLSLILVFWQWRNSGAFVMIPYCCLILQTLYFGLAMLSSLKRERVNVYEGGGYRMVGVLYQLVFSFQFYNLLYYCFHIVPKGIIWKGDLVSNIVWVNTTILSFGAIWIEQFFNMVRFRSKYVLLVLGASILNLSLNAMMSLITEENDKIEFNLIEDLFGNLLLFVTPALHFVIGNKHYQKKRQEKNQKIQQLSKALINCRAVRENQPRANFMQPHF